MDKVVFVDFDDTLFFTKHTVEEAAELMLGKKLAKEEIRKLPKDLKSKIYDKAFRELYYKAIPNKRLIKKLESLRREGYKIVVLTARLKDNVKSTKELLEKYKVPYDELIVRDNTFMKDEEWKSGIIRNYPAKEIILFEDKIDNIEYISMRINKPIRTFLVTENEIKEV